jgi:hypothetical protein
MTVSLNEKVTASDVTPDVAGRSVDVSTPAAGNRLRTLGRLLGALVSLVLVGVVLLVVPSAANAQNGTLHWAANKVYVVDGTNSAWPVQTAANRLADNSALQLVWAKTCPAKAQCIFVKTKKLTGATVGSTIYSYSGLDIVSATVYLDTRFATSSYRNRLTDTTHELGHAVGLNHTNDKTSCMYPDVSVGATTPNKADYDRLRILYPAKR